MSFNVSIVLEDHTNDQFIVRPVVHELCSDIGKPRANVSVVTNPRLNGFPSLIRELPAIITRYGQIADAIVVAVDADCQEAARKASVVAAIDKASDVGVGKTIAVVAIQEAEVWALWGRRARLSAPWAEVRNECDPKERFFDPEISSLGATTTPGGGRMALVSECFRAGAASILTGCPELTDLRTGLLTLSAA